MAAWPDGYSPDHDIESCEQCGTRFRDECPTCIPIEPCPICEETSGISVTWSCGFCSITCYDCYDGAPDAGKTGSCTASGRDYNEAARNWNSYAKRAAEET